MNAERFWRRIFAAVEWPSKKLGEAFPDWTPPASPSRAEREAWLAVISDLTAEVQARRRECADLRRALEARAEDTARLDWVAKSIPRLAGRPISFEWHGLRVDVLDYRISTLSPSDRPVHTLRQAIDAAMAESGT